MARAASGAGYRSRVNSPEVSLAEALRRQLDAAAAAALAAIPDLDAVLSAGLAAAREAWPGVAIGDPCFIAHVASAMPAEAAALSRLHLVDLYLAAACAVGDEAAIRALTEGYRAALAPPLRRLGLAPDEVDDVLLELWASLLIQRPGGRPRIADYRGRGELRAWLITVALRTAYRVVEPRGRQAALDEGHLAGLPDDGADPELDYVKRRYGDELRQAVHAALAALPRRDRTLLRRHHLDGLTVDDLAALHQVHRATAARWLVNARDATLRHVQRALRERLGVSEPELASLWRVLRSQLDVSLERALADTRSDDG